MISVAQAKMLNEKIDTLLIAERSQQYVKGLDFVVRSELAVRQYIAGLVSLKSPPVLPPEPPPVTAPPTGSPIGGEVVRAKITPLGLTTMRSAKERNKPTS